MMPLLLTDPRPAREWVRRMMSLLDAALGELERDERCAPYTLVEAASLLREHIGPEFAILPEETRGRLPAWQGRKVCDYVDAHIAGRLLVAELSALTGRSEAHFSRCFKRTFGLSPHAFVIQRRLDLAAHLMLETNMGLCDIASRCGFTDQAHLCKHFQRSLGVAPSTWRRAHRLSVCCRPSTLSLMSES